MQLDFYLLCVYCGRKEGKGMSQIVVSSCVTQLRRMLLTNHNLKRKIEDMEKKCEENDWVSRLR